DVLASSPRTAGELALTTGAHAPSLYRVLRTLASCGIFAETDGQRFELNGPAQLLRTDAPGSLRDLAIYYGEISYPAWQGPLYSVRTGKPAFARVFGRRVWDFLEVNPEAGASFAGAMRGGATSRALALRDYGWKGTETVVDLGGGDGTLLVELLARQPRLRGIVVDLPHAVAKAWERIAEAGLESRCRAVAGDLLGEIPTAGDAYVPAIVLHDWDDEHAAAILANCRRAMRDD